NESFIIIFSISLSLMSLIFYSLLSCKNYNHHTEKYSFVGLFKEQKIIIMKYPDLMYTFVAAMIVSMTLGSYTFLIPALNDLLHHGDPNTLSYLYGVSGVGALSAGLLK